jgi:hypothetical protein
MFEILNGNLQEPIVFSPNLRAVPENVPLKLVKLVTSIHSAQSLRPTLNFPIFPVTQDQGLGQVLPDLPAKLLDLKGNCGGSNTLRQTLRKEPRANLHL